MEIRIVPCTNGFIVHAGCMVLAFTDPATLSLELTRWLNDPAKVESEYSKKYRTGPMGMSGMTDEVAPRNLEGKLEKEIAYNQRSRY